MKKIVFYFFIIVIIAGVYISANDYLQLPVMYKSVATGECQKVFTPSGEKKCSWLKEHGVEKYEVVWVK